MDGAVVDYIHERVATYMEALGCKGASWYMMPYPAGTSEPLVIDLISNSSDDTRINLNIGVEI